MDNVDPVEIAKFEAAAPHWWNPKGRFGALHDINPARVAYIHRHCPLPGVRVVDVGCGGGLAAEAMAVLGADVTGIDMSKAPLEVARRHAAAGGLAIVYRHLTAEALARCEPGRFDLVTCLELIEHVPRPRELVGACAQLAKPGAKVIFATLNRTWLSFVLAILAAEYLMGLVPRGTHRYRRLITPVDITAWAAAAGLQAVDITGLHYDPFRRRCRIGGHRMVNYLACFARPHAKGPESHLGDPVGGHLSGAGWSQRLVRPS
jgi:2-polyprenyl-6-hydroxyphenyl methylase/3-demethylubiquinone-9 3-methyltransferase